MYPICFNMKQSLRSIKKQSDSELENKYYKEKLEIQKLYYENKIKKLQQHYENIIEEKNNKIIKLLKKNNI